MSAQTCSRSDQCAPIGGPPASTSAPRAARPQRASARVSGGPAADPARSAPAQRRSPLPPFSMTSVAARWRRTGRPAARVARRQPVPALTAPGAEVERQRGMTPGHRQPLARARGASSAAVEQQVAALVEPEVSEVDKGCGAASVPGMAIGFSAVPTAGSRRR